MAVRKVNKNEWTKDKRKWVFYDYIENSNGTKKRYKSKKYLTKMEALKAEREFLLSVNKMEVNNQNMTLENLYNNFYQLKKDKVKLTTLYTYQERWKHLEKLKNIKLKNFNIQHFEQWKQEINQSTLSTNYKNQIFKLLKELLNYATKWYDFNFTSTYKKLTNFTNPNEIPKEMQFFTYEEFKKFISVEDNILYKTMYETFYFCGLRRGELRGLTWDNINFEKKRLTINKNIINNYGKENKQKYQVTTPKTKSSNRQIPIPRILERDLRILKKQTQKKKKFNEKWYVFGNENPITNGRIRTHKNKDCKLANVKQIRIHDFRHSCASLLINNNANITLVAKYLGHTKINETLNTYSHLYNNQMEEIINIINKLP